MKGPTLNRRQFTGLLVAPLILPAKTVFAKSDAVRAVVVGCGNRGSMLARSLSESVAGAEVAALIDLDLAKAEALRDRVAPSAEIFDNLDAAIAKIGRPDVAAVATYNNQHLPIVQKLLSDGVRVYSEKPMTATIDQARAMIALDQDYGGRIQLGLQFRHAPLYAKVKELIDGGAIGEVRYVAATELRGDWFRYFPDDPQKENATNWRYFEKTCGNSILEKLCHDFDILVHVTGMRPERIIASGGRAVFRNRETDDHASIIMEAENGSVLDCSFSLFSSVRRDEIQILGTTGSLAFDRIGETISIYRSEPYYARLKPDEVIDTNPDKRDTYGYHGTYEGLQAFVDSTLRGTPHYPTPRDGWRSTAICCAAHASSRHGASPVSLREGAYKLDQVHDK